ncbi:MAG: OsmC family protein [Microbacteriaceae bacterium]
MAHEFEVQIDWIGNTGSGTSGARDFSRNHEILFPGLPSLPGSAAPEFRGDADRYNPEQLLVAAIAQCHMMTYFYLAVQNGIVVTEYRDTATGFLRLHPDGSGEIDRVIVRPRVTLAAGTDLELALSLHDEVGKYCFIARSVNCEIVHEVQQNLVDTEHVGESGTR